MQGFNVLHPQGFDSFGLPAENFAIKTGTHPAETTKKNIENYLRQWEMLGMGHDFENLVVTSDPKYYKWTQWIFGQFYKNNLVYQSTQKTNWCPSWGKRGQVPFLLTLYQTCRKGVKKVK